jgi:hypothetical protein
MDSVISCLTDDHMRSSFGKKADLENMGKQLDTEFSKFNTTEFKDINTMWSSVKQPL